MANPAYRYVIEIEGRYPPGDMHHYLVAALQRLTGNGEWKPRRMAAYTERQNADTGEQVLDRLYLGLENWGETSADGMLRPAIEFPKPTERTPHWYVDYADIPGHPPMHVPWQDVSIPEHFIHDIRVCEWCINHPLADAELRTLVGLT